MALQETSGRCGPRVLCLSQGWNFDKKLPDAQILTGWREGKGAEPEGMSHALKSLGYKVRSRENFTQEEMLAALEEAKLFLKEKPNPIVIIDYFDDENGGADGHYFQIKGFTKHGDPYGVNPDFPKVRRWVLHLPKLLINWYDRRIDHPHKKVTGYILFAYKEKKKRK